MRQRNYSLPIIQNDGCYHLLCKMADNRGVFPGRGRCVGRWGRAGERIEEALRREIREKSSANN